MSARAKILVTGADLAAQALELLTDYEVVYAGKTPGNDDIVALCGLHDPAAIIVRYGRIVADAIAAAPSLRVISKHGTGTDTIDKAAAQARGVEVVAAAGANAVAVAEHALALMLACAKSVPRLNERMHSGLWDKATHKNLELRGKTVGLVGLGAIGVRFARMANGMDMRVVAFDPFVKAAPAGVELVELERVWRESDVVSLHCPLTSENAGLVGAATLAKCRKGVILVNTARGGLVDEVALLDAIRSGQVRAAGLDSFVAEPMQPGHPFQGVPQIILSPHIGAVTDDAYIAMGVGAAKNALAVLARSRASDHDAGARR